MHGSIDRFLRTLIWLNSEVITKFYLDVVKQVGGLPRKAVRSDNETENSMVVARFMRF